MTLQDLSLPYSLPRPQLARAEIFLLGQTFAVAAIALLIALMHDVPVAWGAFCANFLPAIGLLILGVWMRDRRPGMARISDLAISAAVYIGFSGVIAILIYTRFPIDGPLHDTTLSRIDAALGYSWEGFIAGLAEHPKIAMTLRWVYLSSLPQLALMIVFLAATGQTAMLHRAMIAGTTSLIGIVMVWWYFPRLGPSTLTMIAPEIAEKIGLVHAEEEGARLLSLAKDGAPLIHPGMIMGTIAFPSYHTVMLLTVLWYLRHSKVFWPALGVNLGMIPAILGHGAHHLADVLVAPIPFALAAWLATVLVPIKKGASFGRHAP